MKIVVDDKIPYILPHLRVLADDVVALPGSDITAADVRDAYILIVRTRTRCDRALLEGSSVRLVVTATIGFDHIDTDYLRAAGIAWTNCAGCNATSVAQYVVNSLFVLERERRFDISAAALGIVGVGHVGTAVLQQALRLGFRRILLCDPLRQQAGDAAPEGMSWCSLAELQAESDVITFHTPLTRSGEHATWHLADSRFLASVKRKPVIVNAARGGVVDEEALLRALSDGSVADAVIDTWEGEPAVNRRLLERAIIATPHIAGYSADGKANASRMTLEAVCRFLGRPMTFSIEPPALPGNIAWSADPKELALQLYDPRADSTRLRRQPEAFERLRNSYPLRREHL